MTDAPNHVTVPVKPSSPSGPPSVWPSLRYPDPQAAVDVLVRVFGFEPTTLVPDGGGGYAHIELRWPEGSGGVIVADSPEPVLDWLYVVTTDPDGLYARVVEEGLTITRELKDEEYGNRTFSVVDPWSIQWSFGTYTGQ